MERVLLILGSEERDTIAIKEKEGTIAHTHTHTHTLIIMEYYLIYSFNNTATTQHATINAMQLHNMQQ